MKLSKYDVIDDTYAALLATKTPVEKVAMVGDAHETAKVLVAAGVRMRHPDFNEEQIKREVCRIMLDASD
jgi:hypothetical protein